jgi:ABC-2 type transport system ATP-binding protein
MLIATGLARPDDGSCELFGWPPSEPRAREGLGFLPEQADYEAGFTVGEILALHARLAGGTKESGWAERFAVNLPATRRISDCSQGTARRVALASALIGDPRLLVLDEPTTGLDVASRDRLLDELARFRDRGGTVLVSSHILPELERICDRLAILDRGRLVYEGEVDGIPLSELFRRKVGR